MQILTAGTTEAECAAIAVARAAGIPCAIRRPRRSGSARCSYRKCLQQNATEADGSLIIGDRVPPWTADVRLVVEEANQPATAVATRVAMQFGGAASTRRWLRKHQIQRLHITGTAPTAMATEFLRALLQTCNRAKTG